MLIAIGRFTERRLAAAAPFSNVYGLARTLLALGNAITLAFSHPTSIFRPAVGVHQVPLCAGIRGAGAFCVATHHGASLELARWIAVALLLVVATGWRPRFTGVLHWWLAWSLQANALLVDGGDQVAAMLTLILLPLTLIDAREWHWQPSPPRKYTVSDDVVRVVALGALFLARLQVAGIYFQAAVGKFAVTEWADGTALYYWLTDPGLGAPHWLAPHLARFLATPWVAPLTWSILLLECLLFVAFFLPKSRYRWLLLAGLGLHGGIVIIHGLVSFGCSMFAALLLYLRPMEEPFTLSHARCLLAAAKRAVLAPRPALPEVAAAIEARA
jgi:antimicrobial peptide system SdpB family protein